MPIIEEHKLIFHHIPKTGGTSICHHFNKESAGHQHPNYYGLLMQEKMKENPSIGWPEKWATFAVLRNPISRFISAWQMWKNIDENNPKVGEESISRIKKKYSSMFDHDSIDDFVYDFANPITGMGNKFLHEKESYHFWTISSFLCSYNGDLSHTEDNTIFLLNPRVGDSSLIIHKPTFILQHENLANDFNTLAKIVGFKNNGLGRKNANKIKSESLGTSISRATEARLEAVYSVDYDIANKLITERHVSLFV